MWGRVGWGGIAAALLLLLFSLPALAHSVLIGSTPADGATLAEAPTAISLGFNEPVRPIAVTLIDGAGRTTPLAATTTDRSLQAALPPLGAGGYLVSWRVTSSDSHPVAGSLVFTVGAGTAPEPPAEPRGWESAGILLRLLLYAALLPAAGGALFGSLVAPLPDRVRRRLAQAALAVPALALAGIGLRGALLAGAAPADLAGPTVWRVGFESTLGTSLLVTAAGALLLAAGLRQDRGGIASLGAVIALAGFPLTGHAAPAGPWWPTGTALALHVCCLAFWIGALGPLAGLLRQVPPRGVAPVVESFSALALLAVAVLVMTGLVLAGAQLRGVASLIGTDYGRLLLLKLGLVGLLLTLAAVNKLRLTPALAQGSRQAAARLIRMIRLEGAAVLAILAVTAVLTVTPPPRAVMAPPATGFAVVTTAGEITGLIEVAPARAGRNRIAVTVGDAAGEPLRPIEAAITLANPAAGVEAIARPLVAEAPGRFVLEGPELAVRGRWQLVIELLVTDFDRAVLRTEVPID